MSQRYAMQFANFMLRINRERKARTAVVLRMFWGLISERGAAIVRITSPSDVSSEWKAFFDRREGKRFGPSSRIFTVRYFLRLNIVLV